MEIWVYSRTLEKAGFAGGGALSTEYTVKGLRERGHTVKTVGNLAELQHALASGKPDVLVHHNTADLETVQEMAEKAKVPLAITVQIGLDCGMGLHVAFPASEDSIWNEVAELHFKKFGHLHTKCGLGMMMREMTVKKGNPLQKLKWVLTCPFRLARIRKRLAALEKAEAVIAISPTIAELMRENGVQRKIEVVPQPVDEQLFGLKKETDGKTKNLLFFGGMSWLKGAHVLLEAFSGVKDADTRLWFAGPTEADFDERMVREWRKDPRIEWLGLVDAAKARELYRKADLVAFPSICIESFGRVWAEACAAGTPVVAFKGRGGAADFLEHGKTGWLCELSVESLRRGLETLLSDAALRQQLGQNAREMALNNLHPTKIVEQLEKVYQTACRSS